MTELTPFSAVDTALNHWEAQEKLCKSQLKLWKEAREALSRADLSRCLKICKGLEAETPESLLSSLTSLQQWCSDEERQRPVKFAGQLRQAAEEAGLTCQSLGQQPPTLRLAPIEVELDFKAGLARLSYARLPLGEAPLEVSRILQERSRLLASLDSEGFDPAEYVARLHLAYRRCLLSQGLKSGDRVELMDLLPELAFLSQSDRFRKDPTRESFRPYGKVRLAYDLSRLRRSGNLEHQGARMTLGTATLGTARHKDRVLFLEEAGQGQYYLTLAFQGGSPR